MTNNTIGFRKQINYIYENYQKRMEKLEKDNQADDIGDGKKKGHIQGKRKKKRRHKARVLLDLQKTGRFKHHRGNPNALQMERSIYS